VGGGVEKQSVCFKGVEKKPSEKRGETGKGLGGRDRERRKKTGVKKVIMERKGQSLQREKQFGTKANKYHEANQKGGKE